MQTNKFSRVKVHYHNFSEDDMNDEFVDRVTAILNAPDAAPHQCFFLTSFGGNVELTTGVLKGILMDWHNPPDKTLEVVFYSYVFSSTLRLMFELPREMVSYIPGGLVLGQHLSSIRVQTTPTGMGNNDFERMKQEFMKDCLEGEMKGLKAMGFSKQELSKMEAGEDVFRWGQKAIELLEKAGINKYGHE